MKVIEYNHTAEESSSDVHHRGRERNYWLNILSGDYVKSSFPFDHKGDKKDKPAMKPFAFVFPEEIISRLIRLSNNSDIRLYIILMTGVVLLLDKYTYGGNGDIIVGAPIYRQDIQGDFINKIVVLRNRLNDNLSFKELLLSVSQTNLEALEHINYPLETIPFELNMPYPENEFPLFDVTILLENIHEKSYITHLNQEVIFSFSRKDNYIEGVIEYNSIVYRKETVERIISHYINLMHRALANIDLKITDISVMSNEETRKLVEDFNSTHAEYPHEKTIHELFREQVDRTPQNIAVQYEENRLTYREFDEASDRLACFLRNYGVEIETIVAILLENSIELVTAVLAVLKAGGAYLPIDPDYPKERIDFMLKDSGASIVVNDDLVAESPANVSASPLPAVHADNPAYVIYTSGSTGKPKGVIIRHSSVVNYVWWAAHTYVKGEKLNFPLYSSISFDLTVTSLFTPLITGNTVVIYWSRDKNLLVERIIEENKVGVIKLTPSHLYMIKYKHIEHSNIKCFIVGGEVFETGIAREIFRKFKENAEIYNEYGPTEAAVGCLIYRFGPGKDTGRSVPIGVPLNETRVYILDRNQKPVPVGVSGEIYVSGDGVAVGYLNSPELTSGKFISDPFVHGKKMYRTGDLARMLPEGNIEFLGRIDQQVKIRGFRIELAEIERILSQHKDVKESVVIARDSKEKSGRDEKQDQYLCAYFTANEEFQTSELRDYLSKHLPDYMVPLYLVQLVEIPLTSNGKVNRKALPIPEIKKEKNYAAPRDEIEKKLVGIWSEVLRIDRDNISIDASFFELGGQSLKQVFLISQVHKEFDVNVPLSEIFKRQTIRDLSVYIKGAVKEEFLAIEPMEEKEYYPLSPAQKRMYILHKMDFEKTLYNVPQLVTLSQEIDKERFERVIRSLIQRHESFRTSFFILEDTPVQKINKKLDYKIEFYDLEDSNISGKSSGNLTVRKILRQFVRPFDLSCAPLLRVGLIKLDKKKYMLMLDVHHIISDGISTEIMAQEFTALYTGEGLPELRIQYKDYAGWLNNEAIKQKMKKQEQYWINLFKDDIPVLNIYTDYPRPAVQSFAGRSLKFEIGTEETASLNRLAAEKNVTLYMILIAAFTIFLSKISSQEDIVIGTPLSGRRHSYLEKVIGIFINTLVLRNYPCGEKKFSEYLSDVKNNILKAFENQEFQFQDLLEAVQVKRDASRNPMFDVMFNWLDLYRNAKDESSFGLNTESNSYDYDRQVVKFDMTFGGFEVGGKLSFLVEYCNQLFKEETILKFIDYYRRIISAILESPALKLAQIEIISEEEKKKLLYDFNDTKGEYPGDKTIHELFGEQVEKSPDHIAVIGQSIREIHKSSLQIAYRELNEQSNRLAFLLIKKGVLADNIVGIMMERSVEMIVGIMGILKAGGAYLPIDPDYPQERIDYMLKDSGTKLLVTTKNKEGEKVRSWEGEKILLEEIPKSSKYSTHPLTFLPSNLQNSSNPATGNRPPATSLAYVIYTSGSTGKPKGIIVEHRSLINYIWWALRNYIKGERINFPLYTSVAVDLTVTSIFTPLISGNSIVVYKDSKNPIENIEKIVDDDRIGIMKLTPSHLAIVKETDRRNACKIKKLILGGESLDSTLTSEIHRKFNGNIEIYNEYGPTEATVGCMTYRYAHGGTRRASVPIGVPAGNVQIYLLDKYGHLSAPGVAGEIYIGGDGLSRGYLNRPELTAEKFVECREQAYLSPRLYKTGDLARWLADGNIEFIGRIDYQVKIRGYRIELGEIENELSKHADIKEAVVVAGESEKGSNYLCAYIVCRNELELSELREYLGKQLPDYMIPSFFVNLDKIPVTINGKIDRSALPDPEKINLGDDAAYIPPTNPVEKRLVEIWEKVLSRTNIGINENFFMIGGDSIKSIQIISRMSSAGYKLEMQDLFQYPLISELAPHVRKLQRIPDQSTITGSIPLAPIQKIFFNEAHTDPHFYNQAVMFYAREGFDKEAIETVFTKILAHHDALRMTYNINTGNGDVVQMAHGLDYPLFLLTYDLKNRENSSGELQAKINELQASIDLEKGPLIKLGLFHMDDGDRLLIVIHHLVIDGVSWRILFEDIETLYSQYKRGGKLVLPFKTDSFKFWSEKLSAYADSKTFWKEITHWQKIESAEAPLIPKDFEEDDNYIKDTRSESFTIGEEQTGLLLTKVNEAFRTEINDILLTALGLGIKKTFGQDRILIALEGHGREKILEGMDISRTMGWFTSVYPVLLDVSYADNPGRQIKEIKETLRRIPNKGIGYGILKYITREESKKEIEFKLKPQISFNYLGQFDADVKQITSFQIAKESTGNTQSPNNRRQYEIDISGMIANNRLAMSFSYNETHFKHETMAALMSQFKSELTQIIEFCSSKENIELTPGDFTYKGLPIETVDRLTAEYPGMEDIYTLTPMQEGMLFHALYDHSSYSYFEQMSYRLQGELDICLVEKSLNELVKRHDILRTAFVYQDIERPVQVVLKDRAIDFYYEDISEIGEREEKENFVREFKTKDKERGFDLTKGSLMRVSIIEVDKLEYEFTWSFHHILMDGWCIGILNADFFEIYNSYLANRPHRLPAIKSYRTYIQWLEKQDKEESARYWENYLVSFEEITGIPGTKILTKEENQNGYRNETVSIVFDMKKTTRLNKLAAGNHVTLNTVAQALWGILLGKYNGKEDVVFGAVVSGRPFELEGVESMVGLFINTIPVRICFEGKMKFYQLLQKVQEEALAGEPYHYYPLAEIQSRAALKQNLIDHILVFENYPIVEQIEGYGREKNKSNKISVKLANVEVFEQTNYDFNVILGGSDRLRITFQYNGNVYEGDFVERIAKHFSLAFDQALQNHELEVRELTLLSEEEKNRILYEFNDTEAEYPKDKTIHQLFEEQVERTPDRIALVGAAPCGCHALSARSVRPVCLTYCELNDQSNRLAHVLQTKGVGPDTIVGIMVERSVEMIVGILGILKSGGAYLPIDPDYPQERIDYMLKDSGAKLLVTTRNKEGEKVRRWEGEIYYIEELMCLSYPLTFLPSNLQSPSSLAYVIYTSGSTGTPKGVLIPHRGIINLVYFHKEVFHADDYTRATQLASPGFDAMSFEIWPCLLRGAVLYIVPNDIRIDPRKIKEFLVIHRITATFQSTALAMRLLDEEWPGSSVALRIVWTAGDRLTQYPMRSFPFQLYNLYGPTEDSVWTTWMKVPVNPGIDVFPPIGAPIANHRIYILDGNLKLQPVGVAGEICISGVGTSRGYLNRPEMTEERFINQGLFLEKPPLDPTKTFDKKTILTRNTNTNTLYRTGDLARWLPDRNIEFLGRTDSQMKLRGFRIELGEIENRLIRHRDIKETAVMCREDKQGDKYLCAYIVSKNEIYLPDLRKYLSAYLPDHMIPSFFVNLEKIPLNASGKIDRRALPDPEELRMKRDAGHVPPLSAVEKKLVEIWEKVLGKINIGADENFFLIGGDSIKAIQIISRMSQAGYRLEMKYLFQYPVISELASHLKKLKRIPDQFAITGIIPLTPIQRRFFNKSHIDPHHYNQAVMLYSRDRFDKEAIITVFTRIQEHHDALRITYKINAKNGEFIQVNHGTDYPLSMYEYDLKNRKDSLEELQRKINEIQASIDLENGPLMKLGLLHMDDGDRLLIVIHHLVVDGISWRILFEDMQTLYDGYKKGETPVFPSKTDSFKLWSEKLSEYANSKTFLKEKPYWLNMESVEFLPIPRDFEVDDNFSKDTRSVSFNLGEEKTELLLTKVNGIFKTEINDILLTALGLGIKKTFDCRRVLIALEGHGREEIPGDMDISRTIGWFTSLYPVVMDISYVDDTGRQIKEIKETLRKIPNKGIGYGILKYLTVDEYKKDIDFKLNPGIIFNYLGQFDTDVKQISFSEMARESVGETQSLNDRSEFELSVTGVTTNNRLTMNFSYNRARFKPETIAALVGNVESGLHHIIEYCASRETVEYTPGDFTYKGLSIESIDYLMKVYPDMADLYTLTPLQAGMLFHALYDDSSYSYFEQTSYRLRGKLDISLVEKSLNELVKRHDILRTAFVYQDIERPVQVVLKDRMIDFYYEDINETREREAKENFVREFKTKDKERGFDLTKGSLMRVSIIEVDKLEYEFTWSSHHILMDGWCIGILNSEFFEIYTGYLENRPYRLPSIKPYRTYIQWLEKQDKESSTDYWVNYLDSFEEQTGVPKVKSVERENGYRNERVSVALDREKTAMLNKLAAGNHVTLNVVTQAVWGIVLGKYNRTNDVVFGAVVSGRPSELEGVETMIGLFINTVPVRIRFEEKMKFHRLLQKIQEEAIAGEPYHYHPLAEIQSVSVLKQNLIDHLFIFENYPILEQLEEYGKEEDKNKTNKSAIKIMNVDVFEQTNYDFNVVLTVSDRLHVTFQYNGNVYDSGYVKQVADHFIFVFEQVIDNDRMEIGELTLLSMDVMKRILYDFNDTETGYPKNKTIHQLFEEQVEKNPDRIAVFGHGRTGTRTNPDNNMLMAVTYRELNDRSNRLAYLLTEKGVLADNIISIMMERSVEMIVGILGILKSGGAYMPIDPEYPGERINYMLKDSGTKLLVTINNKEGEKVRRWEGEIYDIEELLRSSHPLTLLPSYLQNSSNPATGHWQTTTSLAYIIYTSGTTGKPKGSMIEHRNVVRLLINDNNLFSFGVDDIWVMFHSYCFDFSVWEMYGALLNGGKLLIIPMFTAKDPGLFLEILKKEKVTVLNQTPAAFYNLEQKELESSEKLLKIKYVIFGGDVLKPAKLKRWKEKYPETKLINMFGITETTVHVTYKEIKEKEIQNKISNIGKPIPTLSTYVMDRSLKLAPIGVRGELVVGGEGVCRGYLNRPELTDEKFIENPYIRGERLYKSGDLGKMEDNGDMEYLGRIDQQVKIRGFRIELGEIENILLKNEKVKEAVVISRESAGEKSADAKENPFYFCAYIVPAAPYTFSISELRDHLSLSLPAYMIPSYFMVMDKIPITPNGKIDRRALPMPVVEGVEEYIAPRDEIEKKLVEIWKKALKLEKLGIRDSYFNLGGDSIKAIKMLNLINKAFASNLKIVDLFTDETIEKLAVIVKEERFVNKDEQQEETIREIEQLKIRVLETKKLYKEEIEDIYPMSDIEKGMVYHSLKEPERAVYHDQMVHQVVYLDFDPLRFKHAVALMVEKHPILRTGFHIGGFEEEVQVVYKKCRLDVIHYDISDMERAKQEQYVMKYMAEDRQTPFNFSEPPLWRLRTFGLDKDNIVVLWVCHHAIIDGWSDASFKTELNNIYLKLKTTQDFVPEKLNSSYKNFIIEQIAYKKKQEVREYWKEELADYKRLNFDIATKGGKNDKVMKTYGADLGIELLNELNLAAAQYNTRLKHLCFGAYLYMLNMLTFENDVVVGLVTNNRPLCEDGEKILGCFLNTVPVRLRIPGNIKWSDYIRLVDRKIVELSNYDRLSLFEIVALIGERRSEQNPIFDTLFNFVEFHVYEEVARSEVAKNEAAANSAGLSISGQVSTNTLFDFSIDTTLGGFFLGCTYSNLLVSDEVAFNLFHYFERILNKFIQEPEGIALKEELIPIEEKQKLMYDFNNTAAQYPEGKTIHRLFEEQVERFPDCIALVGAAPAVPRGCPAPGQYQITYRELNEQSNWLAYLLIQKGVLVDNIIGIMMERCMEMVVGIMGILKSGGAYLPIDLDYPQERIDYMLKDSGARLLVTNNNKEGEKVRRWEGEIYDIEELLRSSYPLTLLPSYLQNYSNPAAGHWQPTTSLAYIIYTSGSTGRPKGVMVDHYSVVNILTALSNEYPFSERDVYLFKTSYLFDVSVSELFGWFLGGGRLGILENGVEKDPIGIIQAVRNLGITHINFVPSMFSAFAGILNPEYVQKLSGLKYIFLAGEALSPALVKHFGKLTPSRDIRLENIYGPTEGTVYACGYSLSGWNGGDRIPIGKPFGNVKLYIFNKYDTLQPIGVAGELHIGGEGVARGYLNRPEMTEERFIKQGLFFKKPPLDPAKTFDKKATRTRNTNILYRTGDLSRWLDDGNIEFLGRLDFQVKVRGFRIELGEIENRLLEIEGISQIVVIAQQKTWGVNYLCAYYVSDKPTDLKEIRNALAKRLPDYMIPSQFFPVERIPLTLSGKVNKQALISGESGSTEDYIAPKTETENIIAQIWKETLEIDNIGVDNNFFEVGGTSLDIIRVTDRLKEVLKRDIPNVHIFQYPTISALAEYFDSEDHLIDSNENVRTKVAERGKKHRMRHLEKKRGEKR